LKKFNLIAMLAIIAALLLSASGSANAQSGTATQAATKSSVDTAGWPDTFIYGVFDSGDVGKALTTAEPLRAHLEQKLQEIKPNIRVVVYTGTSYSAVIAAMKAGRIDGFEVGPFAYVLAAQEANAEPLGIHVPDASNAKTFDPNAKTYYLSTIITKKGNGANIKTLADLKGKSFAFVDPASTSGHLMPASLIKAAGIDPETDMKAIYAGSHPTSVLSVNSGKVDAGATYISNLFTQMKDGKIDLCYFADGDIFKQRTAEEFAALYNSCKDGQIVPIAFSAPIPGTPFAVNHALPDSFRKTLKDLLTTGLQTDADWIAKNGYWYVDPSAELGLKDLDSYYNSLRDVAKILGLDVKKLVK
jgi:phosphonate transport system substrate-binding protein